MKFKVGDRVKTTMSGATGTQYNGYVCVQMREHEYIESVQRKNNIRGLWMLVRRTEGTGMRSIDEIKADIERVKGIDVSDITTDELMANVKKWGLFERELFRAIIYGIPLDRLETICDAERDGRCVVLSAHKEWYTRETRIHQEGVCPESESYMNRIVNKYAFRELAEHIELDHEYLIKATKQSRMDKFTREKIYRCEISATEAARKEQNDEQ